MARSIDKLLDELHASRNRELTAMTRLRRAQTIFDKHYSRTQSLLNAIEKLENEAKVIADRLFAKDNRS